MTTGILDRELGLGDATHSIPKTGEHYTPLPDEEKDGRVTTTTVQTILGDPQDLYSLWSDVTLFPRWQENVISVTPTGPGRSHWIMGDPEDQDGKRVQFDSEITEDVAGQKIAWRSVTKEVEQSGMVTFSSTASGRGTLVTLTQTVKVPGGVLGNIVSGVARRSPKQTVIEDLRHFKQIFETGEIPSVKGQPHGPRGISGDIKKWMYGETNPTPPGTSDRA